MSVLIDLATYRARREIAQFESDNRCELCGVRQGETLAWYVSDPQADDPNDGRDLFICFECEERDRL